MDCGTCQALEYIGNCLLQTPLLGKVSLSWKWENSISISLHCGHAYLGLHVFHNLFRFCSSGFWTHNAMLRLEAMWGVRRNFGCSKKRGSLYYWAKGSSPSLRFVSDTWSAHALSSKRKERKWWALQSLSWRIPWDSCFSLSPRPFPPLLQEMEAWYQPQAEIDTSNLIGAIGQRLGQAREASCDLAEFPVMEEGTLTPTEYSNMQHTANMMQTPLFGRSWTLFVRKISFFACSNKEESALRASLASFLSAALQKLQRMPGH